MESSSVSKTGDFFYGWDLLFKTIQSEVNKKSDLLIALAHFLLTKHYNFRCVGIGDDKTLPEEEGSELLPDSWNDDDTKYSLRYVHDKQLYLLLGHITEDALLVNMMDITTKKVSNICLTPETLVVAVKGNINTLMPSASEIVDRYRKELLDPVFTGNSREVTTQTTTTTNTTTPGADPLRIGEPRRGGSYQPYGYDPRPFGFPDIGRGDLDPLGRGGPGNLFTFPSHPSMPNMGPGPAPRFDPFSPLSPNAGRGPNPDHMRPPNWDSDYFM